MSEERVPRRSFLAAAAATVAGASLGVSITPSLGRAGYRCGRGGEEGATWNAIFGHDASPETGMVGSVRNAAIHGIPRWFSQFVPSKDNLTSA